MAPRRKAATPAPEVDLVEVTPEPFDDDDDWDGVPEVSDTQTVEAEAPAKKSRPGSPLLQATRDYEKAHRAAEKSRKAAAKYRPQIEALEENEAAEQEALARLNALIGNNE
jgi:hypothetical protein